MKQVIYKELCAGAWAIPPSPLMIGHDNDYHTCSKCGEPCDAASIEEFNLFPSHLGEPTMVKIGTIMGQDLFIQLNGHNTDERERNYQLARKMLREAFGMPEKST